MDPNSQNLPTAPQSSAKMMAVAVLLLVLNTFLTLLGGICSEPKTSLFERFRESLICLYEHDPQAVGSVFGAFIFGTIVVVVSLIFKRARNEIAILKVFSAAMLFMLLGSCGKILSAVAGK